MKKRKTTRSLSQQEYDRLYAIAVDALREMYPEGFAVLAARNATGRPQICMGPDTCAVAAVNCDFMSPGQLDQALSEATQTKATTAASVLFTKDETDSLCGALERAFDYYKEHKESAFLARDIGGAIVETIQNVLERVLQERKL